MLAGHVQDPAGQPLAGARLRITSLEAWTRYSAGEFGATSDANGDFAVARIPVGPISIEAVHQASRSQLKTVGLIPSAGAVATQTLTLLPVDDTWATGSIQGQVFRSDGRTPAPGVPVYTNRGGQAVTDASGAYRIDGLPVGELFVRAIDQPGMAWATLTSAVAPSQTTTVNLLLHGGTGTVRGAVFEADGQPAPDIPVYGGSTLVRTDSMGAFVLADMPTGPVYLTARDEATGRSATANTAIQQEGDEKVVQLVLPAQGTLAGRVFFADGKTPASNIKVVVFGASVNKTFTNELGEYRLDQMGMGTYTVTAFLDDFSDGNVAQAKLVFKDQVQRVDLVFRGHGRAVTGIVYDDDGVTPLGARVGLSEWVVQMGRLVPPENPACLGSIDLGGGQKLELPPCEPVAVGFEYIQRRRILNSNPASGLFTFTTPFVGDFLVEAANPFSPQDRGCGRAYPLPRRHRLGHPQPACHRCYYGHCLPARWRHAGGH